MLAAIVISTGSLVVAPGQLRIVAWHAWPQWPLLAAGLAVVAMAVAARRSSPSLLVRGSLAAAVAAACTQMVQPLGDSVSWRLLATHDSVTWSEPLANVVYRAAFCIGGAEALSWVAPVVGVLFVGCYLRAVDAITAPMGRAAAARVRATGAIVLIGAGWHLVFHRGYVENPPISLPPLMLGLAALARYSRGETPVVRPAFWLAVACLCHGMNLAMLPALLWCVALRAPRSRPLVAFARTSAHAAVVALATFGVTIAGLVAAGCHLHRGNSQGGADGRLFVPWVLPPGQTHGFAMLDLAHFAAVGNLLLLSCPLVLAVPLVMGRRTLRTLRAVVRRTPGPAIAALGGAGSAALFDFDLGFPGDYDLMVGMGAPCSMFLLQFAACVPRRVRWWWWAGAGLHAVHNVVVMSALLVAPAAARHPGDLLTVNRRTGTVVLRTGETAFLELHRPPGTVSPVRFQLWLHFGAPGPPRSDGACFALPGEADHDPTRTFLMLGDGASGVLGEAAPELLDVWTSQPMPVASGAPVTTLQVVVTDGHGRRIVGNAVQLVPR
jgi:hypothetical protein